MRYVMILCLTLAGCGEEPRTTWETPASKEQERQWLLEKAIADEVFTRSPNGTIRAGRQYHGLTAEQRAYFDSLKPCTAPAD